MKFFIFFIFFLNFIEAKEKQLNILVFQSYQYTLPWSKQFIEGLEEFKKHSDRKLEFYIETVDHLRLKESLHSSDWKIYLEKKYKNVNFDGILIETIFASKVFNKFTNELYPTTPKIHLSNLDTKNQSYTISIPDYKSNIVRKSIELIKKQNKNLENVYVIDSYISGKAIENELLKELDNESFKTVVIKDFTMDELKNKLSKLSKNSIVFYILNFRDSSAKDFVKEIAQVSNAPIYSFWSTFINTGSLGGYMIDGKTTAIKSLESLLHYIEKGSFLYDIKTYKLFLDYRVLKKYNMEKNDYPSDSIFVNKPIPIWKIYPYETLFAISTIVLLSLLLVLTFILKVRNERIAKMEESIFQQSKQATMGDMISVIAHQWRQPLNNIALIVQSFFLKYQSKKINDAMMDTFNTDILKQINYMSNTIDDFKDFYKPNKIKSTFDIKEELFKTIELIENSYITAGIKIEKDEVESFNMIGYANELSHSFLIILQNANEALLDSEKKDKIIKISSNKNKSIYKLSIENNGNKIPSDIIKKIFEPYFSTKNEKNGTGIGLYMAKTIIEKHFNASIEVFNTDNGVKFELRFYYD